MNEFFSLAEFQVNEEGSEAAAATGVVMIFQSALLSDPPRFVADHPFMFAIIDTRNKVPLFAGHVGLR